MNAERKKFVVITGATGRLGYHIVRDFVNQGYEVRILCRSIPKAKTLFLDILEKIELMELDFSKEIPVSNHEIFNRAFFISLKQTPVTHVVLTSGSAGYIDRHQTKIVDFKCHKFLIDSAKNVASIEKFIYISTMAITRPWSYVSIFLNLYIKNVMYWKLETENYLRTSGLNFVIIRPGGLLNEKESKVSAITIAQGDKDMGLIERASVAKVVVSVCEDTNFKTKVSFEVFSKKIQYSHNFVWTTPNLIEDEGNIISNRHRNVSNMIVYGFWSIALAGTFIGLKKQILNILKKK